MLVFIKSYTGKTFPLEVDGGDSIEALKKKVNEHEALDSAAYQLVYAGKPLKSGKVCTRARAHARTRSLVQILSLITYPHLFFFCSPFA